MAVRYPTPTLPMDQPVMPQPPQPVMPVQPQPVMPQPMPQPVQPPMQPPMPVMPVQPGGPRPIPPPPPPPQNPLMARLQALKAEKRQLIGQIRAIDEEIQSIKMEMRGLGGNTGGGIGGLFSQPNRPTPPPFPGG